MKKIVSFCFLSILLFGFGLMPKMVQGQAPCQGCLWLENIDPATPAHELTTLETPLFRTTDVYRIHFDDTCNLDPYTKISLEWEITLDGLPVGGDIRDYATVKLKTWYNRINKFLISDALPRVPETSTMGELKTYPGAVIIDQGLSLAGMYSLDFFYLHFFQATETQLEVYWKQVGNYEISLKIVERTGGTPYPSFYYDPAQRLSIGGHQSGRGDELASTTLVPLDPALFRNWDVTICNSDAPYHIPGSDPIYTFNNDTTNAYIPFYDACHHLDSIIILDLTILAPIALPTVSDTAFCLNDVAGPLTAATTEPELTLEWLVGGAWGLTPPIPATNTVGKDTFYVRQALYSQVAYCHGDSAAIVVTIHDLPVGVYAVPQAFSYCKNEIAPPLTAPGIIGTEVEWFNGTDWTTTPTTPVTTTSGVFNYLVRRVDSTTRCASYPEDTVKVTVLTPLAFNITGDTLLCTGGTVVLRTSETSTQYIWKLNGVVVNTTTVDSLVVSQPGEYTVVIDTCNTESLPFTLTEVPVYTQPNVADYTPICLGETTTIDVGANADNRYQWFENDTATARIAITHSIDETPLVNTDYIVKITHTISGCSILDTFTVEVLPLPVINLTSNAVNDTVCYGADVEIQTPYDATYTYNWGAHSGLDTNKITVDNIIDLTKIYLTVTDNRGCVSIDSITIDVEEDYTITVAEDSINRCYSNAGVKFEFDITNYDDTKYNYSWVPGNTAIASNPAEITLNQTAGTYIYTIKAVSIARGCEYISGDLKMVIRNMIAPTPSITSSKGGFICYNGQTTLDAGDGYAQYLWSTGEITQTIDVTITATTRYDVTVTDASGCEADTFIVINMVKPVVEFLNIAPDPMCSGAPVTITATLDGNFTYTWTPASSTVGNVFNGEFTNTTDTIIRQTVTLHIIDAGTMLNCEMTIDTTFDVKPNPIATIETDNIFKVCMGSSINLYGSDSRVVSNPDYLPRTYTWIGDGVAPGDVNKDTILYTPIALGIDTVEFVVENAYVCGDVRTVFIYVDEIDTNDVDISITSNTTPHICLGDTATITLNAPQVDSVSWFEGPVLLQSGTNMSLRVSPNVTTDYDLTLYNGACTFDTTITVEVKTLPTVTITPDDTAVCHNEPVTLTASGAVNYVWSTGSAAPAITPSTAIVGNATYYVTGTDADGCVNVDTAEVVVMPRPVIDITPEYDTICFNGTRQLTVAADLACTYVWNNNPLLTGANYNFVPTAVGPAVIVVKATAANTCTSTDTAWIEVEPIPVVTRPAFSACEYETAIDIYFDEANPASDYTYTWSTGAIGDTVTVTLSGNMTTEIFIATITDNNTVNGCSIRDTIIVTKNPKPVINLQSNGLPQDTVCQLGAMTLSTDLIAGYTYQWSDGVTVTNTFTVNTNTAGTFEYGVTVTTGSACVDSAKITIEVLPLPNVVGVSDKDTVCFEDSFELNASGATTYIWRSKENLFPPMNINPVTIVVADYVTAGTYTFYVTGNDGHCDKTDSVVVTVMPLPIANITNHPAPPAVTTACQYDTLTFTAAPGMVYYDWGVYSSDTTSSVDFPFNNAGLNAVYLKVTDQYGCVSKNDTALFNVTAAPVDSITVSGSRCDSLILNVSGNANYTYNWEYIDENGVDILHSPDAYLIATDTLIVKKTGTVTVTVTDNATLCNNEYTQEINVFIEPTIDITTFENDADIIFDMTDTVKNKVRYDVIVRNECNYIPKEKVVLDFEIFKMNESTGNYEIVTYTDGAGTHNYMTSYVRDENSIKYYLQQKPTDVSPYTSLSPQYYDKYSVGSIPAGESNVEVGTGNDRKFYISSEGGLSYKWLYLRYLVDRRVTVEFDYFTTPGKYKVVYTLMSVNGDGTHGYKFQNDAGADEYLIGGGTVIARLSVLAVRSIELTIDTLRTPVTPAPPVQPIVVVTPDDASKATLKLYPNPIRSKGELVLEVDNAKAGKATVAIFDNNGHQLETFTTKLDEGKTTISHYLNANYPEGFYFVRVMTSSAVMTERIVIHK